VGAIVFTASTNMNPSTVVVATASPLTVFDAAEYFLDRSKEGQAIEARILAVHV
jgi:hypothetical protein